MKSHGAETYLAQGAAGNAFAAFLNLLVAALYNPLAESAVGLMVILPIYLVFAGICGGVVGLFLWLTETLFKLKLGFLTRAATGILIPLLITLPLRLLTSDFRWAMLLAPFIALLSVILPAALMSGSRFNPLRSLLLGLEPAPPLHDFGRAFSFFPAVLLRFGSTLGLSETLVYLANLTGWRVPDWQTPGHGFPEAILAIFYFGVTAIISFGLPRKQVVLIAGLLSNAAIIRWVSNSPLDGLAAEYLPRIIPIFVGCWCLFALGRLLATDSVRPRVFRILPVTMFEIRIRHALNYW